LSFALENTFAMHGPMNVKDIHALGGIRTRNPSKRAAVDPHLIIRGHWDHQKKRRFNETHTSQRG